ncbi:MAG: hypothetical protein A2Y82_01245 [Candidatus Buchananbacteria bacterium RBG_13_36_9]|uniref:Uncharacterized protein n=1 Tax=Candidatus Buchananbacteria bacterium RBG_13_36_9 TaxID=1797530 RepID=A0A1G1XPS4_9BACT|nr:MAG: hypothetical protein A2Y82_01245 [Candidatus Buchananbacteria bacterium RBG_13_36_9]
MKGLEKFNFWSKKVDKKLARSAQAVIVSKVDPSKTEIAASACGQGSCNCGGGCNGECANGN